ncbi:DUF3817 domain-containing protein [Kocuria sp.]|uniref:DUF3817 domain-containing protein n=1 Tax=Kocuria sp. TaxID=1871328 RepID=UPI0026DCBCF8|nr:DUF3817 domain-containing protein [Kocuria sp.]MDO4918971.1 DUF3817 domain-containing protein [Kocuria sp.]
MSPRILYRVAAGAEAVTWGLLVLGMVGKHLLGLGDVPVRMAGGAHGFVFLGYCVSTVVVWTDRRWPARTGVLGLVLSVVPFATVPFERGVERRGLLADAWRVAPAGAPASAPTAGGTTGRQTARTPAERLLAVILRWPLLSGVVLVAFVAALFSVLLTVGPPTQWFR